MEELINLIQSDQTFFIQLGVVVVLLAILLGALHFLIGQKRWYGYGKIIGLALGYAVARAPGAVLGLVIGHLFDITIQPKRVRRPSAQAPVITPEGIAENWVYQDTLFAILGNLTKMGGAITTIHLNQLQALVKKFQLNVERQRKAEEWFQYGQQTDFNVRQALFGFTQHNHHDQQQTQSFMWLIIHFAEKIQPLNAEQYAIVCTVAYALHFSTENFAHMAPSSQKAGNQEKTQTASTGIQSPFQILGVSMSASNKEIKSMYRKLMGRYHPDKLISKNLPEDLIQLATKRTQEIKDAYEKICQERGI